MWPADAEALIALQDRLAKVAPEPWVLPEAGLLLGGCWVCFPRGLSGPGAAGDPTWAAAVVMAEEAVADETATSDVADASYTPGLLALRVGRVMAEAVRALRARPAVLLIDATGRDHPRRAGLALHLGAELDIATVGITHRPLLADGDWPPDHRGATSPLRIDGEVVGCWLRTQPGVRPLAVHPGWRTGLDTALDVVTATTTRRRTPEPMRRARHRARLARARAQV
jgi:deoxyribonuclease V